MHIKMSSAKCWAFVQASLYQYIATKNLTLKILVILPKHTLLNLSSISSSFTNQYYFCIAQLWGIRRSPGIPLTKASGVELWCFLWSAPEPTFEQTIKAPVIWDAIALIMIVMIEMPMYSFQRVNFHIQLGISAALLPMLLPNFRVIGKVLTQILRLRDFTRSCGTTSVRLQNLSWYKTSFVSRQLLHLLSKLQNWIVPKRVKTCIVSNTEIEAAPKPALHWP